MISITVELRWDDGIYFDEILVIVRLNELSFTNWTNWIHLFEREFLLRKREITAGRENSVLPLYKPLASRRLT